MLRRWFFALFISASTVGCALLTPPNSTSKRHLSLVATDLVSVIVQIRQLDPSMTTLNFAAPETEYGKLLLRTLRDAGYGIQMVDGTAGDRFVSYAIRTSETDAGMVNDYLIKIDEVEVRREYNRVGTGIYPASLVFVSGSSIEDQIVLDDRLFAEQGGDQSFLSGVELESTSSTDPGSVREVVADSQTQKAVTQRTDQQKVLSDARRNNQEDERQFEVHDLSTLSGYRRVVILFPDNQTLKMGVGNKLAIRELVSDFETDDVFEISACYDFDGEDEMSEERAIRIKQEIVGHGIPSFAVLRAACVRANFRHPSDDSPVAVVIVHYRKT